MASDPETDKAGATMDVNVGSFSDPPLLPGLAHCVEHMLFLGTTKYPKEDAYISYIEAHSGTRNATTGSTSTKYYFEIATPAPIPSTVDSPFRGALDRFSQFFISPLFLENALDREIRAIDSENKNNLQSDFWRVWLLKGALSNPGHPWGHFSTGNWATLHDLPIAQGLRIQDECIKFYSQYYSANRMKLAVLGGEDLDTLQHWVEELFSPIKNMNLDQRRWDGISVYTDRELLTQTFVKPVSESHSLELVFPYRDEEKFYESHPSHYLSHLISHEGPGSILAYTRDKGWADGLSASEQSLCTGSSTFKIRVNLTKDGLKHYQKVVNVVFQAIAMIREQDPQRWIVDEQMRIKEINFRFQQKSSPIATTATLASNMQKSYRRMHILSGPVTIKKFDPELIVEAISYVRPDNFQLIIVSQDFSGDWDQKEKWYGTEYKTGKIPKDFLAGIQQAFECKEQRPEELHFPHRNEFIPNNFEVEKKGAVDLPGAPHQIGHDNKIRTWHKKDDKFRVPKAHVRIALWMSHLTTREFMLCTLHRELVTDALREHLYHATICSLWFTITNDSNGYFVTVGGYNDKLYDLFERVLVQIRDMEVQEDRFKIVVERVNRELRNEGCQEPYHQIGTYSRWLRTEKYFLADELLEELKNITPTDVQQFYAQALAKGINMEALCHGNLNEGEALRFTNLAEDMLKPKRFSSYQKPTRRSLVYPSGCNFIDERQSKDPANPNNCIEYNLYVGHSQDRGLRVNVLLLDQLTKTPAFHQLRTIEQLGYAIFSGISTADAWSGYKITIQSEKDCRFLESRVENFLSIFEKTLKGMSEDEFESHKRAVINHLLEKPKSLDQENMMIWTHIVNNTYDFKQAEEDVKHITSLTKQTAIAFYAQFISPSSPRRAKISTYIIAQARPNEPSADEKQKPALGIVSNIPKEENVVAELTTLEPSESMTASLDSELTPPKVQSNKAVEGEANLETPQDAHGVPVLITDVHAFKASFQLSTAIWPVGL